jgi:hypothetical protein
MIFSAIFLKNSVSESEACFCKEKQEQKTTMKKKSNSIIYSDLRNSKYFAYLFFVFFCYSFFCCIFVADLLLVLYEQQNSNKIATKFNIIQTWQQRKKTKR